ncbi:MAG: citrate synthase [Phycisphaerales bacterium]|nr:citrate synthase [Phycisphaerales bacterium]
MTATATPTTDKPASATKPATFKDPGLANVIAADTSMSFIDGAKGVLEYVGIDIDSLARNSTFEESVFLLWNRRLPRKSELDAFVKSIQQEYDIPDAMHGIIARIPADAVPMQALRTLVSALALFDPETEDGSPEANQRKSIRLLAKTATLIAAFDRHRKGKSFVKPDKSLNVATNFLWMLRGEKPTEAMAKALDVCLILHADHGFNASTFAAMVTISTLSDMYSAVTTAIGTLKGPLHGGANEEVMVMLQEIGSIDNVEPYIKGKLERKERIMGFGHRVYKAYDPRATYLKTFAQQIASDTGNQKLYEMSRKIEEIMREAVAAKGILPNVDFYSATTYYSLGLDVDLFTPMFAMSRVSGWCGHCIEYLAENKLIRPGADYVGPQGVKYVPFELR